MGLELDWLEREERYRRRVLRFMTVGFLVVAALVGTLAITRARAVRRAQAERARAAEAARAAEVKRQRDAFVADSSATANRLAGFLGRHGALPLEGLPFIEVPLPADLPVRSHVERLWTEYARVVDPSTTAEQEEVWFRQYYVDVLNDGPLRGRSVLLPAVHQSGTQLGFEHYGFAEITRAQVAVGAREEVEEAPVDTTAVPEGAAEPAPESPPTEQTPAPAPATPATASPPAQEPAPASAPASEPSPTGEAAPPSPPPAPVTPATPPSGAATSPSQPAPAATPPDTAAPAPTPAPELTPAPPDTTPKP